MKVLEIYAGIGGVAEALAGRAEIVAAFEQSPVAIATYRANHPHRIVEANLTGRRVEDLLRYDADLWWMSPPCQPFTVRGARKDLGDARTRTLLALIDVVRRARPRVLALENVPGFLGSEAHARVTSVLRDAGYHLDERVLCPTALGIPNRRRRYYLVASHAPLAPRPARAEPAALLPLARFLDPDPAPELFLDEAIARAYAEPMHVARDVSECFTAAYGRSHVHSGSFLREGDRLRRFSPREGARLLGFREGFVLPNDLERAWKLLGSSVSVHAVREMLGAQEGLLRA